MNVFIVKKITSLIVCVFLVVFVQAQALSAVTPLNFESPEQERQYQSLVAEFRCPKCQNQNLASSNAGIAEDLKHKTYEMVMAGKTDVEIRTFMIDRYGDFVTYKPPVRPSTFVLWYFPPVLLLLVLSCWVINSKNKPLKNKLFIDDREQNSLYQGVSNSNASSLEFNAVNIKLKTRWHFGVFALVLGLTVCGYVLAVTVGNRPFWYNQSHLQQSAHDGKSIEQIADELLTEKIDMPPTWIVESPSNSQALITAMQMNVHRHAEDSGRWMRLGKVFLAMRETESALIAMERANRLEPSNAKIATTYAQTSFLANGEVLPSKTEKVLTNLLYTHDANNQKAIMILIMSETRKGNHDKALMYVDQLTSSLITKSDSTNSGVQSSEMQQALANLDSLRQSIAINKQQSLQTDEDNNTATHP